MYSRTVIFVTWLAFCECALYSSFWAPLFEPRLLSYRVEAAFPPDGGARAREPYERLHGYRGETLISRLGNGRGPSQDAQSFTDVHRTHTYTHPGAYNYNTLQ